MNATAAQNRSWVLALIKFDQRIHNLNRDFERQTGITVTQWNALDCLLSHPAASATDLSDLLEVHPSTLSPMLRRLIKKRLIFETADPRDSRKKLLGATRQGKQLRDKAEACLTPLLEDVVVKKKLFNDCEVFRTRRSPTPATRQKTTGI